jgi:hypothetical protein
MSLIPLNSNYRFIKRKKISEPFPGQNSNVYKNTLTELNDYQIFKDLMKFE